MADSDPVADFLTREHEDLAGLGEDFSSTAPVEDPVDPSAGVPPVLFPDDAPAADKLADSFDAGTDGFGDFNAGSNDLNDLTSTTNDLDGGFGEGGMTDDTLGPEISEPFEPSPPPSMPRMEPEKIRLWREEQKVRLENKDLEEEVAKKKMRADAKKQLEEWNAGRLEQLGNTKKQNRVAEADLIRERDSVAPGQEWERIASQCEFNPKGTKNTKDTGRLRSMLLQLKQMKAEE